MATAKLEGGPEVTEFRKPRITLCVSSVLKIQQVRETRGNWWVEPGGWRQAERGC